MALRFNSVNDEKVMVNGEELKDFIVLYQTIWEPKVPSLVE